MQAAGFVLVGGKSTRMGRDKALLPLDSRTLVEDVAGKVAAVTGNVALIGRPERYEALPFDCLPDANLDLGPIAGIEAALASGRGAWNLIVACDMPGLAVSNLRMLLEYATASNTACVVSRDSNSVLHPLCAVYHISCLAIIRESIAARRLRLHSLITELNAAILDMQTPMWNLNTPEEWQIWNSQAVSL